MAHLTNALRKTMTVCVNGLPYGMGLASASQGKSLELLRATVKHVHYWGLASGPCHRVKKQSAVISIDKRTPQKRFLFTCWFINPMLGLYTYIDRCPASDPQRFFHLLQAPARWRSSLLFSMVQCYCLYSNAIQSWLPLSALGSALQ